jgi:hypothetical protein
MYGENNIKKILSLLQFVPHSKHYVSIIKTDQLMLHRDISLVFVLTTV